MNFLINNDFSTSNTPDMGIPSLLLMNTKPLKSQTFTLWEFEEFKQGINCLLFLPNTIAEIVYLPQEEGNFIINESISCLIMDKLFARAIFTAKSKYYNILFNQAIINNNKETIQHMISEFKKFHKNKQYQIFETSEKELDMNILQHFEANDITLSELPQVNYNVLLKFIKLQQ